MTGRSVIPLFYESWGEPRPALQRPAVRGKPVLARPTATAAMRVPERVNAQLPYLFPANTPQLFVHEGARQALERRLTNAFPGP